MNYPFKLPEFLYFQEIALKMDLYQDRSIVRCTIFEWYAVIPVFYQSDFTDQTDAFLHYSLSGY